MEDKKAEVKKSAIEKKIAGTGFSWKQVLLGFLVGVLLILGIRYVTYSVPEGVHYHANFAVYVDGVREKFENPLYYEEVTSCNLEGEAKPEHRVHMHDQANDVIHVHDGAVTWGNLFQNIGWNVGKGFVDTSTKLLVDDSHSKVTYILNGEKVSNIITRVIGDKDKLLVSYGSESNDTLNQQFTSVSGSAAEYDTKQDPASCSGSQHKITAKDRIKHLF